MRLEQKMSYYLATCKARSFYDLLQATFKGLDKDPNIEFIGMPEDFEINTNIYQS